MTKRHTLFLFSVAVVLAAIYYWHIDMPRTAVRQEAYRSYLANTDYKAVIYEKGGLINYINKANQRVLAPFALYYPIEWTAHFTTYQRSFLLWWLLFDMVAIFFSLYAFFKLLLRWFTEERAMFGIMLFSVVWAFTFKDQSFTPWSLLEVGFISLGLTYILEKHFGRFLLVFIFGMLNKNSIVFTLPFFLLSPVKNKVLKFGLLILVYFVIEAFLSKLMPVPKLSLNQVWEGIYYTFVSNTNPRYFIEALFNNAIFWLPFVCLTKFSERPPQEMRLMALSVIPYFLVLSIVGGWDEIRLLAIAIPFLLPWLLNGMFAGEHKGKDILSNVRMQEVGEVAVF